MGNERGAEVEVDALVAGYRGLLRRRIVLRSVTFQLAPGTVTGLVGLNGVGKTTLLRVLLGFLRPWKGRVGIGGMSPRRYRRQFGIGYLPESLHLPPTLTVRQFLHIGARLSGVKGSSVGSTLDELLQLARIGDLAGHRLEHLSRGQARLAGLAFALAGSPAVLLLDEPENGLDPHSRIALRGAVGEAAARGCTILSSSHDLAELQKIAGRILVLEKGLVAREVHIDSDVDLESLVLADDRERPDE